MAIASALIKQPQLVLADEPTANLDSKTGQGILELMHEMRARNNTSFIISLHDFCRFRQERIRRHATMG